MRLRKANGQMIHIFLWSTTGLRAKTANPKFWKWEKRTESGTMQCTLATNWELVETW